MSTLVRLRRSAKVASKAVQQLPKTLVLNSDYQPISITSSARSIMLCRANKAMALESTGQELHSETEIFDAPSVIVLSNYVSITFTAAERVRATASRVEIMRRDQHECQYCGSVATTLDHVHPISKGGKSTWENLVAACWPCNHKKGNSLLSDRNLGMSLRRPVEKPEAHEAITLRHVISSNDHSQHASSDADAGSSTSYRNTWRKYLLPAS